MSEKIYYSWENIEEMVEAVARKVKLSKFEPDWIVSINRGGLVPGVMLSHLMKVSHFTLDIQLRDGTEYGLESNAWMSEEAFGYDKSPRRILIVDDINDSGATLQWLIDDWESGCFLGDPRWAESVWHGSTRFAALVDNSNSGFKIDYCAKLVTKTEEYNPWFVFPWEKG